MFPNLCLFYDLQSYQRMMRPIVWLWVHVTHVGCVPCVRWPCVDCQCETSFVMYNMYYLIIIVWHVCACSNELYVSWIALNTVGLVGLLVWMYLLGWLAYIALQQYSRVAYCAVYKMTVIVWTRFGIVTHLTCFMRHCITQSVKASCKTPFELNSKCSPFNWFYEALLCHWYSLWRLHPCKAPFELNSKCSPFNCFVTYASTRAL